MSCARKVARGHSAIAGRPKADVAIQGNVGRPTISGSPAASRLAMTAW